MIANKYIFVKYFIISIFLTFLDIFVSTFALFTILFVLISFFIFSFFEIKNLIHKKIINFKSFFLKIACLIMVFIMPNLSGLLLNQYLINETIYYAKLKEAETVKYILLNYKMEYTNNRKIIQTNLFNAQKLIYNVKEDKYEIIDAI